MSPLLWRLVVVVALLAGAGCSDSSAPDDTGAADFHVEITHEYGVAEITQRPTRVVSIGYREHDILLALGVVPVALQQWYSDYDAGVAPYAEPLLHQADPVIFSFSQSELDIGEIAKLKPDLIVGTYRKVSSDNYALLSQIAPTLVRPKDAIDYGVPYDVETRMIGKALGKEREAETLIQKSEAAFTQARRAHPEFAGKTVAVGYPIDGTRFGIYGPDDPRAQFLRKLGFTIPTAIADLTGDSFSKSLSAEKLELVGDVDLLVILDFGLSKHLYDDNELYQSLSVVRAHHVIYPVPYSDAMSHNTVLSIPYTVKNLVPVIAKTLGR